MFLERGVASYSFGSVLLAVHYTTLSGSFLPDNELEVKGGWLEPCPAGKAFLYVSVNPFNSRFHLVEYIVHHVCSIIYVLLVIVSVTVIFKTITSHMVFPVKQVWTLEERLCITEEVEKNPSEKRIDVVMRLGLPPSTLSMIIVKKKGDQEHADYV
jgi:hypothetical protein